MKKPYLICTFFVAAGLELFLWFRFFLMSKFKDYTPPDSWYFQNVALVGFALLLVAPVLRHGVTWQRVVAGSLCVVPALFIFWCFYYTFAELTEP